MGIALFSAFFAKGVSASSHDCLLNIYGVYEEIVANSAVISASTVEEMGKFTISEKEMSAATASFLAGARDGGAEINEVDAALSKKGGALNDKWGWPRRRRRRRRRYRCWYNLCGNS